MKRAAFGLAFVTAAVGARAPAARADERPAIVPPAGWRLDESQSAAAGKKLTAMGHFGYEPNTVPILANANVFVAPRPGVVLSVELVVASGVTEREAAARAAVDELHATSQRAAIAGGAIAEDGWQEKVDPAARQIEATLAWRDRGAHTHSDARLIFAADDTHIASVTGECFAADDADPKLVTACNAALATLDPGVAAGARIAIGLAPPGSRPSSPAPAAGTVAGAQPAGEPHMADGPRAPLPPIVLPAQDVRTVDRRPVYVGIGLVVLAGVFWWNRRRRARLEDKAHD